MASTGRPLKHHHQQRTLVDATYLHTAEQKGGCSSSPSLAAVSKHDMSQREKKPSAFHRFMMNFTSVLGLPVYKNQRARQLGRVPPPPCFQDERLDESPDGTPSNLRRSYSVGGSKDRSKKKKHPRQWRRRGRLEWESNCGHRVTLGDVSLDELCEAERRALQEVALAKLNRMDFNIPSSLVKVLSQLSTARNKVQRRSFRKKLTADRDQNHVFGQPLDRAVFQDMSVSSRRLSTPLILNPVPRLNSTPVTKLGGKGSSRSISTASILSDTPSDTPLPSASSSIHNMSLQFKSHSSSRLHGGVSALCSPFPATSDRHFSLNIENEETQLQLLREGSSMFSLDASSVQLSPRSERKGLLTPSPPMVPAVVQNSVDYLHSKGITTEGIFRISGSKARIAQLRDRFDRGENVELAGDVNPHDVACLLKEYLRSLPEPLIVRELYSYFLMTRRIQSRSQRRDTLRLLCLLLPRPNRDTLKCLLHFLNQVALYSADIILMDGTEEQGNRMSEENLGMIMGPNILHKRKVYSEYSSLSKGESEDVSLVGQVVEDLIKMEGTIFKVTGELLDEAMDRLTLTDPPTADYLFRKRCKLPGLDYDEDDSLSFQELTDIGVSREELTPARAAMRRSKSSELLRLKNADPRPSSAMERRSEVADSASPIAASDSNLTDTDKEPSELELLVPRISLGPEDEGEEGEEEVEAHPPDDSRDSLHEEGLPRDSPNTQSHIDGPNSAAYLVELGGESPISLLAHNRMSSESSSGSNPVLPFPGACKTEGSDSAFSFTSSSINTGSRSSCEGLTPATEMVEGGSYSVVSPTRSHDSCHPSESPRPTQSAASKPISDTPSVPQMKKETKKYSKDEADMLTISMRFRELESKLAGLDTHISQWSAKEKAQPLPPATTRHWTTTQEQFSDLDSHLEQLTSELTILDQLSQPVGDGGLDKGGLLGYYSSLTSQHSSEVTGKVGEGSPNSAQKLSGRPQNNLNGRSCPMTSSPHPHSQSASQSPSTSGSQDLRIPPN